jgi:hypothetical protein
MVVVRMIRLVRGSEWEVVFRAGVCTSYEISVNENEQGVQLLGLAPSL